MTAITTPKPGTPVDDKQLTAALRSANLPALVMVLHQLTGEQRWLEDPYRPTRTKGMDDHDSGGFPEDVQQTIRDAAAAAIREWSAGKPAAVPAPTGERLLEMMRTCMGEYIPDEYEGVIAEEMGFRPLPIRQPRTSTAQPGALAPPVEDFSVVVVGAGISGLAASLRLRQAGIHHVVLEKNTSVGGTWLENSYPGAGVDTPSYLYSFSFFPRNWSAHFGKRDELAGYLQETAEHFDLLSSIRFGVEVRAADYDEAAQRWTVSFTDEDGKDAQLSANAIVTAVGQLNRPKVPNLPGVETFQGPLFHSARWPENLDLTDKRVAVVGSGASAVQIVPAIADTVDQLTVFQRSPGWIAPNTNYRRPIPAEVHWLMEHVPYYHAWYRFRLWWTFNDRVHDALQIDPAWAETGTAINETNDKHRQFFTRHLREQLEGREDLQEKTLPDYPPFGKRMLLDTGWFAALRHPNVELVTDAVASVWERGVRTTSGESYEADVVVFATGFEAQRPLYPMEIRGRSGRSIREVWGQDDARAYLGITTPDFPNLFFTYGPNTNLGHGGSAIFVAECQVRYIIDLISTMIEQGLGAVECRTDVHDRYNQELDAAHNRMIWSHRGMRTWYRNLQGRVVTNTPWRNVDYWRMTHSANLADFLVEPRGEPAQQQPGRAA